MLKLICTFLTCKEVTQTGKSQPRILICCRYFTEFGIHTPVVKNLLICMFHSSPLTDNPYREKNPKFKKEGD